jgi:hypothetical protein
VRIMGCNDEPANSQATLEGPVSFVGFSIAPYSTRQRVSIEQGAARLPCAEASEA